MDAEAPPGTAVVDARDLDLVERDTSGDEPRTPPSEPGEGGG
jgi:hypothetical protein